MAKVIINAKLSKRDKHLPAGIMLSASGMRDIGLVDYRKVTYKDQHLFYCGIYWDEQKRQLMLVEDEMDSAVNIAIFATTYELEIIEGKILLEEEIQATKEIASVCRKFDIGGYEKNSPDILQFVPKTTIAVIKAKEVSSRFYVLTGNERVILRNSAGFNFVCDFKKNNWFTLKPGASELELYDYNNNIETIDLIKDKFVFPGLDRKVYDVAMQAILDGTFDQDKHTIKYV